uniref:Uncharacterized protein n=1 Tax=Panagrolaimus sp. ES5 TaxID=591445 RepID=A0AC34GWF0_9BILA
MSLYFAERVKEQIDDCTPDNDIIFTFPWIFNSNSLAAIPTGSSIGRVFATSYKMATSSWLIYLNFNYDALIINNLFGEEWNGICFLSYTLYYDDEMRYEFFSSTQIQMEETEDEHESITKFQTPEGYMAKFIEGMKNKKFSKCVVSIELDLPAINFYEPSFKKRSIKSNISDEYPVDYENDFRFEFLKNGDYTFECLDGTLKAYRDMLFSLSKTMKKQLSSPRHYPVGIVKYTVAVIKPIITYFHSLCFKLPDSYDFDYIESLLNAIEFFEPLGKRDMIRKVHELVCQKFAKESHDFSSLLLWLSFSLRCKHFWNGLTKMVYYLIANEHYFKWQKTFPENARNMQNPLYRQLFERADIADNLQRHPIFGQVRIDDVFIIIFANSFLTNIIM